MSALATQAAQPAMPTVAPAATPNTPLSNTIDTIAQRLETLTQCVHTQRATMQMFEESIHGFRDGSPDSAPPLAATSCPVDRLEAATDALAHALEMLGNQNYRITGIEPGNAAKMPSANPR